MAERVKLELAPQDAVRRGNSSRRPPGEAPERGAPKWPRPLPAAEQGQARRSRKLGRGAGPSRAEPSRASLPRGREPGRARQPPQVGRGRPGSPQRGGSPKLLGRTMREDYLSFRRPAAAGPLPPSPPRRPASGRGRGRSPPRLRLPGRAAPPQPLPRKGPLGRLLGGAVPRPRPAVPGALGSPPPHGESGAGGTAPPRQPPANSAPRLQP